MVNIQKLIEEAKENGYQGDKHIIVGHPVRMQERNFVP